MINLDEVRVWQQDAPQRIEMHCHEIVDFPLQQNDLVSEALRDMVWLAENLHAGESDEVLAAQELLDYYATS